MRAFLFVAILVCGLVSMDLSEMRAQSYAFSVIAGSTGQFGKTDGTNSVARFDEPSSVVVDSSGNVFVADTSNHAIRQLTPVPSGWAVTTIAGLPGSSGTANGSYTNARFFLPHGIAIDSDNNLYVADTYNHTIRKLTLAGDTWDVSTFAGTPGVHGSTDADGGSSSFYYPNGLAVDGSGNVFVADTYNHTIRLLTPSGGGCFVSTPAGLAGTIGVADGSNSDARFRYPGSVAVDAGGNVYIADTYNSAIRRMTQVSSDWVVTTLAGIRGVSGNADGTNINARFNFPFGISVDSLTNLYVADTGNNTIRKVTPYGTNWVASTISAAQFNQPKGIAVDGLNHLFVADTENHTIQLGRTGFSLQAALVAGKVVVSWPAAASSYVLETRGNVASGTWSTVSSGIFLSGTNYVKTNTPTGPPAFFRLRSP
jgi:sugar lactone lactonase YvrE